jgi:hypothetical protein
VGSRDLLGGDALLQGCGRLALLLRRVHVQRGLSARSQQRGGELCQLSARARQPLRKRRHSWLSFQA